MAIDGVESPKNYPGMVNPNIRQFLKEELYRNIRLVLLGIDVVYRIKTGKNSYHKNKIWSSRKAVFRYFDKHRNDILSDEIGDCQVVEYQLTNERVLS